MNIQWYPGHMTKTRRMIAEQIKNVDAVCEILDARIPVSSRNPDVDELTAGKPRLVVLNRVDQADPGQTRRWAAYFREKGYAVLEANAKGGAGTAQFAAAVRELLRDKLEAYAQKGQVGRVVRVMVLGIPNVGKSTFINTFAGKACAKTGNKPGVTKGKQWIRLNKNVELLDTPGRQHAGTAGHAGYPVAQVRRPGGGQASGLHRGHQGRCVGHRGVGLLSHGVSGEALYLRAGGAV